ncbi:MAG: arylesterase [Gammaproteobacteria bacterium]
MKKLLCFVLLLPLSFAAQAKTILILGDSLSAAYGMEVQQGWAALLQRKLAAEQWPYTVINASISGETSAGGLARIDRELAAHRPAVVVVELGANDGLRGLPPQNLRANLAQIIRQSQQAGAAVLLLNMRIPPNYGKRYSSAFYAVYPALAEQYQIPWVPFILEDVALQKQYLQKDGLHPNADAQPLLTVKVWEHLKPLLSLR